jgi:hypothetical protein
VQRRMGSSLQPTVDVFRESRALTCRLGPYPAAVDGSPFQACPPGPNGDANTGFFSTPDGQDLPPMTLRCWATVTQEDGSDTASLQLVSPSDAPDYSIPEDLFPFGGQPPGTDNMAASRWGFVVTAGSVRRTSPWSRVALSVMARAPSASCMTVSGPPTDRGARRFLATMRNTDRTRRD